MLLIGEQAIGEMGKQCSFIVFPYLLVHVHGVGAGGLSAVTAGGSACAVLGSLALSVGARVLGARCVAVIGAFVTAVCLSLAALSPMRGVWAVSLVVAAYVTVCALGSSYSIGVAHAARSVAGGEQELRVLNGRRSLVRAGASVLGPSLVGLALIVVSSQALLAVDAVTWLVSAAVFSLLVTQGAEVCQHHCHSPQDAGRDRRGRRIGLARRALALSLPSQERTAVVIGILAPGALAFARRLVMTLLPFLLLTVMSAGSVSYGVVYSCGGIGYVVGGLVCSVRFKTLARPGRIESVIALLAGLSAACLMVMLVTTSGYVVGAGLFAGASGALGLVVDVVVTTQRQAVLATADLSSVTGLSDSFETIGS
ncbi:MFS transporter [Actinomyces urogenitalis]|uniref:MFS transporter n=1 Tax=Actinomyces urogenitalis TaxID=103621 RepID=UPI0024306469|nr:MFS transporter [Actinomyces urogenitalis]MCI7457040.1 MFS transporter [Actinomyces urogenitalis]